MACALNMAKYGKRRCHWPCPQNQGEEEILSEGDHTRGVKLIFTGGHISLLVAFKGPNVILGLHKCNYSLTVKRELSTAARQKQGARPDKTMWRAGFGPRALCLPPVIELPPLILSATQDSSSPLLWVPVVPSCIHHRPARSQILPLSPPGWKLFLLSLPA